MIDQGIYENIRTLVNDHIANSGKDYTRKERQKLLRKACRVWAARQSRATPARLIAGVPPERRYKPAGAAMHSDPVGNLVAHVLDCTRPECGRCGVTGGGL